MFQVRSVSDDGWQKLDLTCPDETAARLVFDRALTFPGDVVTLARDGVTLATRRDERTPDSSSDGERDGQDHSGQDSPQPSGQ